MRGQRRRKLIVGTRTSRLALWQTSRVTELLKQACPEFECEVKTFVTEGDEIIDTPLPEFGGSGVFTTLIERGLRRGEVDFAVHSLKDLPIEENGDLIVAAVTARADARDGLIARDGQTLATLPDGATVGTSSVRRQAQLLAVRGDLKILSIRGNVDTRVRKTIDGKYDATVLAAAGLQRLGLTEHVTEWLPFDVMLPAPGQGALAVQCRADDKDTLALLQLIDDAEARASVTAERKFLQGLGGGCSLPIAAFAAPSEGGDRLQMNGLVISPNGRDVVRVEGSGEDATELGERLAREATNLGAATILSRLTTSPVGRATPEDRRPLQGRRIVVTRAADQAQSIVDRLSDLGATSVLMPAIRIVPVANLGPLDEAIRSLATFDWVVFTSSNGVAAVRKRLAADSLSTAIFDGVKVAAVGPSTAAALAKCGIESAFVPDEYVGEAIADGLGDLADRRILLLRAEIARETLPRILESHGASVTVVPVYHTLPADFDHSQINELKKGVDAITFTSGSTVRNFIAAVRKQDPDFELAKQTLIACIGPVTAQAARELELNVGVIPSEYTTDGLIDGLVHHFQVGAK